MLNKISALLVLFVILIATGCNPDEERIPERRGPRKTNDIVYFVPQFSDFKEISMQDMLFLKKVLKKADRDHAKAVVVELDTPGGRIDVALKYVSILSKSEVPVITYLNPQGISAGMIIALASNQIAINPNGVIGDAMPIQLGVGGVKPITEKPMDKISEKSKEAEKNQKKEEKNINDSSALKKILKELQKLNDNKSTEPESSKDKELADQKFLTVFFKMLQVLAEKNNRPVRVIRAMADPYQKLTVKEDGIEHTKVSPLTLSAAEAKKLKVVDYVVKNRNDLLDQANLGNCRLKIMEKSPTEQIMAFLSYPALAAILLIVGMIGIYVEVRTPGFGVPGALGITALTLFFLGHMASGSSDWGPIVIFFVGVILLALEIFVIPGFGIVGILGIGCMIISLFGAFGIENLETATNVIGLSFLCTVIILVLLTIYVLPKSTLFKRITLNTAQESSHGYSAPHQENTDLVGKHGIAHTSLRPAGTVLIEEKRYDARTEGDFIDKGSEVQVVSIDGFQVTVEKLNHKEGEA